MKNYKCALFLMLFHSASLFAQIGFQDHVFWDEGTLKPIESVQLADLDNDGDLDVIGETDFNIVWYENCDGFGTFSIYSYNIPVEDNIHSLTTGDLDGDGDLDIVTVSQFDGKVKWYKNLDGEGTFGPAQRIGILGCLFCLKQILIEDMDEDGDPDILLSEGFPGLVLWYENLDNAGTFAAEAHLLFENNSSVGFLIPMDVDEDGDRDFLFSRQFEDGLFWLDNEGESEFTVKNWCENCVLDELIHQIIPVDIDNDGHQDLLTQNSTQINWFRNTGNGTYESTLIPIISSEDNIPLGNMYVIDLDGDGDNDIVVDKVTTIGWYENNDNGNNFSTLQILGDSAAVTATTNLAFTDMDYDGDMDIVQGRRFKVHWLENANEANDFSTYHPIRISSEFVRDIVSLDLDDNGFPDLITIANDKIGWIRNIGGQFSNKQEVISNSILDGRILELADLDGDEDLDLIKLEDYSKLTWHENLNESEGFGPEQFVNINEPDLTPVTFHTTDWDNDGDQDILTNSNLANNQGLIWYENLDGNGSFSNAQLLIGGPGIVSIHTSDLDGDGDQDVLASEWISFSFNYIFVWYENIDGQGTFGPREQIMYDFDPSIIRTTDLDEDGDIDILAGSGNHFFLFENTDGQGNFSDGQDITNANMGVHDFELADIDLDADLDIIAIASYSATTQTERLFIQKNQGLGYFGSPIFLVDAIYLSKLSIADFNLDGKPDIAYAGRRLGWIENLGPLLNRINGQILFDTLGQGCAETSLPIANELVITDNDSNSFGSFSNEEGSFSIPTNNGVFTTQVSNNFPNYFSITPTTYTSTFDTLNLSDSLIFCVQATEDINDLQISLYPLSAEARPGFDVSYALVYKNQSSLPLSGNITLNFDAEKLAYLSSSQAPDTEISNTITFSFEHLLPLETTVIILDFNIFTLPTVQIGDILEFTALITPLEDDIAPDNNTVTLQQSVIGAYDPNDITVLEGKSVPIEEAGNYLHYIIRFQNTGNAAAINVRVENNLSELLDWKSMKVESMSHPGEVQISDGYKAEFIFNRLFLPDSISDEAASHGYIAYKIRPRSNVVIGDIVANEAAIYFDFNPPIFTNTVFTEFTSLADLFDSELRFFPNPTTDVLHFKMQEEQVLELKVFDQSGRLVKFTRSQKSVDLSNLPSGAYFVLVRNEYGHELMRKVIKQ